MDEPSSKSPPSAVAGAGGAPRGTLRDEALAGVRNVGAATYAARGISVLSLIVVARFLAPVEFGTAAIALLVGTTLSSLSDFGMAPAIVSLGGRASKATFARAARYRLAFSAAAFAAVFIGADAFAALLGAPSAAPAVRAMSLAMPIAAAGFAPASSLAATRKFGALARAYVALSVTQAVVTITLAALGWSFWAVVVGYLAGAAAQVSTQWALWTDRSWPGAEELGPRRLLELGGLVTLSWLSLVVLFTIDRLFVASTFGTAQLGYYALAVTWGSFAADSLNQVVGTVALPTFAALGEDRAAMGRAYLTGMRLISFASAPAAVGLVLTAPELLQFILGAGTQKWMPSLVCLQVLAIFGWLKSIVGSANSVLLASQSFRRYAYLVPVPLVAFVAALIPALQVFPGIVGVAVALLTGYLVNAVLVLRAISRIFGLGRTDVLRNISGSAVASAVMLVALLPLRVVLVPSWVALAVLVAAGAAVYLGAFVALGRKSEVVELKRAVSSILRFRSRRA